MSSLPDWKREELGADMVAALEAVCSNPSAGTTHPRKFALTRLRVLAQIEKTTPEVARKPKTNRNQPFRPGRKKKHKNRKKKRKKGLCSCCADGAHELDEHSEIDEGPGFAGDLKISAPVPRMSVAPQRRMMPQTGDVREPTREVKERKKSFLLSSLLRSNDSEACASMKTAKARATSRRQTAHTPAAGVKHLVSKKKLRFMQDGFDLDLSYITPRIIAMGWPSTGKESVYRNPATQVKAFIEHYHAGHLKVFNLCKERAYPASLIGLPEARLEQHGFYDHNAPPFALLRPFCVSASRWLKADPLNTVAVHCKAGKGRTGMMIACLLVFMGECGSAEQALELFARQRTANRKGVTIPSQQRYVRYLSLKPAGFGGEPPPMLLVTRVVLKNTSEAMLHPGSTFTLEMADSLPADDPGAPVRWTSWRCYDHLRVGGETGATVTADGALCQHFTCEGSISQLPLVAGDVKIILATPKGKLCTAWFHTAFVEGDELEIGKAQLDKLCKDKKHRLCSAAFSVVVHFRRLDDVTPEMVCKMRDELRESAKQSFGALPQGTAPAYRSASEASVDDDAAFLEGDPSLDDVDVDDDDEDDEDDDDDDDVDEHHHASSMGSVATQQQGAPAGHDQQAPSLSPGRSAVPPGISEASGAPAVAEPSVPSVPSAPAPSAPSLPASLGRSVSLLDSIADRLLASAPSSSSVAEPAPRRKSSLRARLSGGVTSLLPVGKRSLVGDQGAADAGASEEPPEQLDRKTSRPAKLRESLEEDDGQSSRAGSCTGSGELSPTPSLSGGASGSSSANAVPGPGRRQSLMGRPQRRTSAPKSEGLKDRPARAVRWKKAETKALAAVVVSAKAGHATDGKPEAASDKEARPP